MVFDGTQHLIVFRVRWFCVGCSISLHYFGVLNGVARQKTVIIVFERDSIPLGPGQVLEESL